MRCRAAGPCTSQPPRGSTTPWLIVRDGLDPRIHIYLEVLRPRNRRRFCLLFTAWAKSNCATYSDFGIEFSTRVKSAACGLTVAHATGTRPHACQSSILQLLEVDELAAYLRENSNDRPVRCVRTPSPSASVRGMSSATKHSDEPGPFRGTHR